MSSSSSCPVATKPSPPQIQVEAKRLGQTVMRASEQDDVDASSWGAPSTPTSARSFPHGDKKLLQDVESPTGDEITPMHERTDLSTPIAVTEKKKMQSYPSGFSFSNRIAAGESTLYKVVGLRTPPAATAHKKTRRFPRGGPLTEPRRLANGTLLEDFAATLISDATQQTVSPGIELDAGVLQLSEEEQMRLMHVFVSLNGRVSVAEQKSQQLTGLVTQLLASEGALQEELDSTKKTIEQLMAEKVAEQREHLQFKEDVRARDRDRVRVITKCQFKIDELEKSLGVLRTDFDAQHNESYFLKKKHIETVDSLKASLRREVEDKEKVTAELQRLGQQIQRFEKSNVAISQLMTETGQKVIALEKANEDLAERYLRSKMESEQRLTQQSSILEEIVRNLKATNSTVALLEQQNAILLRQQREQEEERQTEQSLLKELVGLTGQLSQEKSEVTSQAESLAKHVKVMSKDFAEQSKKMNSVKNQLQYLCSHLEVQKRKEQRAREKQVDLESEMQKLRETIEQTKKCLSETEETLSNAKMELEATKSVLGQKEQELARNLKRENLVREMAKSFHISESTLVLAFMKPQAVASSQSAHSAQPKTFQEFLDCLEDIENDANRQGAIAGWLKELDEHQLETTQLSDELRSESHCMMLAPLEEDDEKDGQSLYERGQLKDDVRDFTLVNLMEFFSEYTKELAPDTIYSLSRLVHYAVRTVFKEPARGVSETITLETGASPSRPLLFKGPDEIAPSSSSAASIHLERADAKKHGDTSPSYGR